MKQVDGALISHEQRPHRGLPRSGRWFLVGVILVWCLGGGVGPAWAQSESATLSAGSASAAPGATGVGVGVSLDSQDGAQVSATNFDLSFDSSRLSVAGASLGSAASSAGKLLDTSQPSAGVLRIVIYGGTQAIPDGTLVNVSFNVGGGAAPGTSALGLGNAVASTPSGTSVPLTLSNGSFTVTAPPATNTPPPSATPTATATPSATASATRTPTPTRTATNSRTPTNTSGPSLTPSQTRTPSVTSTPGPTLTPSRTRTPGPSATAISSATRTATRANTSSPSATVPPAATTVASATSIPPTSVPAGPSPTSTIPSEIETAAVATGTALAAFDQAVAATATSLAVAAAASDPVADPMPSALLLLGGLAAIAAFGAGIFLIVRSLIRPKRPGPPASTAG